MTKLALAVEDESRLGPGEGELAVDARVAAAAFRQLGETVLLYRRPGKLLSYFASARISAVSEPKGGRFGCRLSHIVRFMAPVDAVEDGAAPGARRMIVPSEARFSEVMERGGASSPEAAAREAAAPFDFGRQPLDAYLGMRAEVLRRWSYRCAITDTQFAPGEAPELRFVAIQPRALGGPQEVRNYLPMVELAERAWLRGDISATDEFDIVAVQSRLDPDLLAAFPHDGRLVLPDDRALWPDPEYVTFHRTHIFGR